MSHLVSTFHIFVSVLLIAIVLLQQGKGADMGATFGGGSNTVFGASGADNLLSRVTRIIAFLFMATSLFLAANARRGLVEDGKLFQNVPAAAPATSAPVTPAPAADAVTDSPAATLPSDNAAPANTDTATAAPIATPQATTAPASTAPVADAATTDAPAAVAPTEPAAAPAQ